MCFSGEDPKPTREPTPAPEIEERSTGLHVVEFHSASIGFSFTAMALFVATTIIILWAYKRCERKLRRRRSPRHRQPEEQNTTLPQTLATANPAQPAFPTLHNPFLMQHPSTEQNTGNLLQTTHPYHPNTFPTPYHNPITPFLPFQIPPVTRPAYDSQHPLSDHRFTELLPAQDRRTRPMTRRRAPTEDITENEEPPEAACEATQTPLTRF